MSSLYVLLAIFLWSSLGIVVKLSGVEVHVLIFYSMIVSIIVQGLFISQPKIRKQVPPINKLRYPLILGLLLLANTFTFFYAFQNTTIANAVLTHYTAPIIVAFAAPLFLKESITLRIFVVIIIATTGLWIMLDGLSLQEKELIGIFSGLASGFAYAALIIFVRSQTHNFHPLVLSFFTNTTIAILLLPFIREIPIHAVWSFLFMGIIHSTIAPILYYKGLQRVTANRAAVLGYLEPVCAILLGILLLHENITLRTVVGGGLVLFSGLLTMKHR
jgi:drug/metabolite transporter (DMT)-like permease